MVLSFECVADKFGDIESSGGSRLILSMFIFIRGSQPRYPHIGSNWSGRPRRCCEHDVAEVESS